MLHSVRESVGRGNPTSSELAAGASSGSLCSPPPPRTGGGVTSLARLIVGPQCFHDRKRARFSGNRG